MSEVEYIVEWPRMAQIFVESFGFVCDGIFYRDRGHGSELGEGAPLIHLIAAQPAKPRGRPSKKRTRVWMPATTAYGLDANGQWWSVRWDKAAARARTISGPPYSKMGRKRVGWVPTLKEKAVKALHAATVRYIAGNGPSREV